MAKKNIFEAVPAPAASVEPAPKPVNRAVRTGTVRVRANENLVEWVDGVRLNLIKGEEGEVRADRLAALGPLVTPL